MASFEELEKMLREASELLDKAAAEIRDLGAEPNKNVRRIGEAIALVSEIRHEVYARRPDLKPQHLSKNK